jgi:pimeloyl-ACP methyl ester carboxylesterase
VRADDEFACLPDNAAEAGVAWTGPPVVSRQFVDIGGRQISALRWGNAAPETVLLHGGGQNAHTWDTVALALARPLLAIDLPGHGHSDWRTRLWAAVGRPGVATMLVRGSRSAVVTDGDVAEFQRRCPAGRVVVVEGAGHSIQGDQPVELAAHLAEFLT